MILTLADRIAAFERAYPKWRASWPRLVREQNRDVLYATWLIGNDYRNATKFYGSYPPGYLARVMALFPDVVDDCAAGHARRTVSARGKAQISIGRPSLPWHNPTPLHVFSGALPAGPYTRVDINPTLKPDIVSSVYDLPTFFGPERKRRLIIADPPYSAEDALKYRTRMVDRRRALAALAAISSPGGHLVWLDTVWPMHRKAEWVTVGRIAIVRSTNHRIRMCTIFERQAA